MSDCRQTIKTFKIFCGDSASISNSSAKVTQEIIMTVGVDGKPLAHISCADIHLEELAVKNKIVALREDIGRHNTIDMLGGYALLHKINLSPAVILTTGRISSEIVYKVWNMGISAIISHLAPTANAVALSRKANILLIGYVRNGKMNIYSQERRVKI